MSIRDARSPKEYKYYHKIKSVRRHGVGYGKMWKADNIINQLGDVAKGLRITNG